MQPLTGTENVKNKLLKKLIRGAIVLIVCSVCILAGYCLGIGNRVEASSDYKGEYLESENTAALETSRNTTQFEVETNHRNLFLSQKCLCGVFAIWGILLLCYICFIFIHKKSDLLSDTKQNESR